MTIREYAQARGISYDAARQTVTRYKADLQEVGGIEGSHPMQLTDRGIALLDSHRNSNPLAAEIQRLRQTVADQQQEIADLQAQVADLQGQLESRRLFHRRKQP